MLPDALLLDLDGTLVDSETTHTESIEQYFVARGFELTQPERDFVIGHAWQEIYAYLRVGERLGISLVELQEEAVRSKGELLAKGELHMPVLPGGKELVHSLHGLGVHVAIVSGSCRAEIEQVLPELGIAERLSFYYGAEDYQRGKPAPDGYLAAAERLSVDPRRCLVVEDSTAGIRSGLAAGMRVVATSAVNPTSTSAGHQDQSEAHRIVDGLEEMSRALVEAVMREGVG